MPAPQAGALPPDDGPDGPDGPPASATDPAPAPLRGVKVLAGEEFSLADAIGGVRGAIESTLPGLLFVVVYVATHQLLPPLVAAAAVALVAVVVRLAQRTPATQAFSGLLGVGIGVVWAWRTGEAENYFAWGLWVNVAWALGALISIVVGWAAVGVIVSFLRGHDQSWRTAPEHAGLRRRYVLATWLWVGVFAGRLAVQVPLYLQGSDSVGWLGTAKLVMGLPLFALGLWITWLLVAAPAGRAEPEA
ncbi:MAG TPA: DUF3159 domain-containing protein [Actinotalea sp.]